MTSVPNKAQQLLELAEQLRASADAAGRTVYAKKMMDAVLALEDQAGKIERATTKPEHD